MNVQASLVTQMVKHPPAMHKTWIWCPGQEDPLEMGTATHSSILAWRISWTEELGGLQSTGLQRVRHDCVTNTHINNVHFNQYWVIWGQNEICTTGEMVCFYFLNLAKFCLGDGCMGSFQLPELTLLESISRSASNHSLPSLWPEYFQFWPRMVLPAAKQNEPPTLSKRTLCNLNKPLPADLTLRLPPQHPCWHITTSAILCRHSANKVSWTPKVCFV